MTTRVYFDFASDATADTFMEAVTNWLCESVAAPSAWRAQALRDIIQPENSVSTAIYCPRYWLYEDASASSERIPLTHPSRPVNPSTP